MSHHLDPIARDMFGRAIANGQAGELLECLWEGGSATIDAATGRLVFINEAQIQSLAAGDD